MYVPSSNCREWSPVLAFFQEDFNEKQNFTSACRDTNRPSVGACEEGKAVTSYSGESAKAAKNTGHGAIAIFPDQRARHAVPLPQSVASSGRQRPKRLKFFGIDQGPGCPERAHCPIGARCENVPILERSVSHDGREPELE